MRRVHKVPGFLTSNLQAEQQKGAPLTNEQATKRWRRFTDTRNHLKIQLCKEQFGLCCYSEINLSDFHFQAGMGSHIEHVEPKSSYPARTFDYDNLMLSALSDADLQHFPGDHKFAGHHKEGNYNPSLFIGPQNPNCRDYFIFSISNGEVSPNLSLSQIEQDKAQYTIDLLNLNAPYLKAERRKWLQELDSAIEMCGNDPSAIEELAEIELTLTPLRSPFYSLKVDQLRKFHSASRLLFGALGDNVTQRFCPQIN